ncbi:MAG: cupin domain-containing protein, partial [Gemmatimonadetes bacterium]
MIRMADAARPLEASGGRTRPGALDAVPSPLGSVALGAHRARGFAFAPGARLARHRHERPALVVVLGGAYEQAADAGAFAVSAGEAVFVPAGEAHAETIGRRGARALLVDLSGSEAPGASFRRARGARAHAAAARLAL